jgi:molecular chaperone Hsp33
LYSQTLIKNTEGRRSHVELDSENPLEWIETYYLQSEQRPARAFRLDDEHFVLLAAQPDADLEWLENLSSENVAKIIQNEETNLLETRKFRFHCGCSVDKILPALSSWKDRKEELFQGDPAIEASCPRCGAKFLVTPDMI